MRYDALPGIAEGLAQTRVQRLKSDPEKARTASQVSGMPFERTDGPKRRVRRNRKADALRRTCYGLIDPDDTTIHINEWTTRVTWVDRC